MIDQSQLLFDNSTRLTRPLVDLILQQSTSLPFDVIEAQSTTKCKIHQELKQSQSVHCNELFTKLPASLQRSMEVASESGASTWLSMALPYTREHLEMLFVCTMVGNLTYLLRPVFVARHFLLNMP